MHEPLKFGSNELFALVGVTRQPALNILVPYMKGGFVVNSDQLDYGHSVNACRCIEFNLLIVDFDCSWAN